MKKYFISILFLAIAFFPSFSFAQNIAEQGKVILDKQEIIKARVVNIVNDRTNSESVDQTLNIEILEGGLKNKRIEIKNDYFALKENEVFYLKHTIDGTNGAEYFMVDEPYRIPKVLFLVLLFTISVLFFGGIQGVRGLLSLIGSLFLIIYILLPGILNGYSPLLITTVVSSLIVIVGSYITHGFNKTTSSAVVGMIITVIITGILAYFAVHWTRLTGYGAEEAIYLNLNSGGSIDVLGILLGGIMIGLLGVLYDVAIGQAISVEELLRIAPETPKKKIYERAVRIGREHIGALVNTLAIAYVGAALPLLLLFYNSDMALLPTLNKEIFSTEIVRTMVGSIGLVIAVPITTIISLLFLTGKEKKTGTESHTHSHSHIGHRH